MSNAARTAGSLTADPLVPGVGLSPGSMAMWNRCHGSLGPKVITPGPPDLLVGMVDG